MAPIGKPLLATSKRQPITLGFRLLGLFDVIWVFDRTTSPQKWKMYVCLSFDEGWFLRINSRNNFRPCASAPKSENTWLEHDSFVECSLLALDEFEIEESLRRAGIVGRLNVILKSEILNHLIAAKYIRDDDKARLRELLC
jgi:hypothetical protein